MTVDELRRELDKMDGDARVGMTIKVVDELEDGTRYGRFVTSDLDKVRGTARSVTLEGRGW